MGYRSEVAFAIKKDKFRDFKHKLAEAIQDCDEVYKTDNGVVFTWSWAKWYEDYEEVIAVSEVMDECEDLPGGHELYGFVRIGENSDDIETKGSPYEFGLGVSRTISKDEDEHNYEPVEVKELMKENSVDFIEKE